MGDRSIPVRRRVSGRAAADAAGRAGYVARGAVAAAVEGPPELRADAAHALGAALWAQGDLDGARSWLTQSVEPRPSAGARWLLGRTLDAQADAGGDGGERAAARELLVALAADDCAPREAFEAREDWIEAADAATAGLTLRERLRLAQREELREREWLEAAASLPSLAAYALAAAGQLEDAVARWLHDQRGAAKGYARRLGADEAMCRRRPIPVRSSRSASVNRTPAHRVCGIRSYWPLITPLPVTPAPATLLRVASANALRQTMITDQEVI